MHGWPRAEGAAMTRDRSRSGVFGRVRKALQTQGDISRQDRDEVHRRLERLKLRNPAVAALVSVHPALSGVAEEV